VVAGRLGTRLREARDWWVHGPPQPLDPWNADALCVLAEVRAGYTRESWRTVLDRRALDASQEVDVRATSHPRELRSLLPGAHVFLTSSVAGLDLLTNAPRLRLLQFLTSGSDSLRPGTALDESVAIATCTGVASRGLAEHALALMLALARGLPTALSRQRRWQWSQTGLRDRIIELRGRTAGVLGLGHAGRELAHILLGLGMRVVTWDGRRVHGPPPAGVQELPALTDLLATSEFVIVCLPETPATRGLLNDRTLPSMRRGAFLINISRGSVVDSDALASLLRSGHVAGAGLDVLDQEPPRRAHPLRRAPNVIITPHIAGNMHTYREAIQQRCAENVRRLLRGDALLGAIARPAHSEAAPARLTP
jgi:D-3-phosphoglycerate dehydrogenase / 2-oxoglutarate reductase